MGIQILSRLDPERLRLCSKSLNVLTSWAHVEIIYSQEAAMVVFAFDIFLSIIDMLNIS